MQITVNEIHPNAVIETNRAVREIKEHNIERKEKASRREIEQVTKDMASYICNKEKGKLVFCGGIGKTRFNTMSNKDRIRLGLEPDD